jgi:hypothetical protein
MPLKEVEQSPKTKPQSGERRERRIQCGIRNRGNPYQWRSFKANGCIKELWYAYPANERETTAETESAKKHP